MRLGKRVVLGSLLGMDDDNAMDGGSVPQTMSMPPKGAFFFGEDDLLPKLGSWLNWALCYVLWSI